MSAYFDLLSNRLTTLNDHMILDINSLLVEEYNVVLGKGDFSEGAKTENYIFFFFWGVVNQS